MHSVLDRPVDPVKAAPFDLGSGEDACLLLHGFTGTPWEVRPLGEALAAGGYRAVGVRLPGHGTTPAALAQVTWRDWENAAEAALRSLAGHRRVFLAGLSMGALLGLSLAARHPSRVQALALMAPAMRFLELRMKLLHRLRRLPLVELLRPWIGKSSSDLEDPDARAEAPVLARFPSARLYDLFEMQERARASLPSVRAPTLVVMARHDHVVALEAGDELRRGLSGAKEVRLKVLERGFHLIPRDHGRAELLAEVAAFFTRWRGAGEDQSTLGLAFG